jgi:hypothetical protein
MRLPPVRALHRYSMNPRATVPIEIRDGGAPTTIKLFFFKGVL